MAKPNRLKRGDKVAIVSLSSGILGESFVKHELDLGIKRMEEYGLVPVFMENTLKGLNFIANNPEARANDLKQAFADDEIKGIFCSIGGIDTYRTLPYLLSDEKVIEREFGAYEGIGDNYPKYVISMDRVPMSRDGIIHMSLIDFLLQ